MHSIHPKKGKNSRKNREERESYPDSSATRFLACAAEAALGPAGPSGTAGRFAVAAAEDKRRETAVVDILTAGDWRGGPGSRQRCAVEMGRELFAIMTFNIGL
jgi:hypothetical protein